MDKIIEKRHRAIEIHHFKAKINFKQYLLQLQIPMQINFGLFQVFQTLTNIYIVDL